MKLEPPGSLEDFLKAADQTTSDMLDASGPLIDPGHPARVVI